LTESIIESPHFAVQRIADGVFAAIAKDGGFALCNAGIVDLGDATLVFDSMLTPMAGADLQRTAEQLTGRPVDFVVNSHYHGDHIRGNGAFPHVRVLSTVKTRELMVSKSPKDLAEDWATVPAELERIRTGATPMSAEDAGLYIGWFEGILATPRDLRIRSADLTFESELVIHGSRRKLQLMSYGGGHSPSDLFAYLPEERVVFLGDLLSVGYHPWLTDGDPQEFWRISKAIRALRIETALPGHGAIGTPSDIEETEKYIAELGAISREAIQSHSARETLEREPVPERYSRWKFATTFRPNLMMVYDAIRANRFRV
jgi:cyclase